MVVLYKTANEDKANIQRLYPYHIAIIKTNQGNLERNKLDFLNRETAIKSYYERLTIMKGNEKNYQGEEDDEELPF